MQRQEIRNYSDDQIFEAIQFGLTTVDFFEPPEILAAEVFRQAVSMYGAKQIVMQQGPQILGLGQGV